MMIGLGVYFDGIDDLYEYKRIQNKYDYEW